LITVFNRRQLIVVLNTEKLWRIRNALAEAGIECYVRTHGSFAGAGNRSRGVPGVRPEHSQQYTVYVKKQDYDCALRAIQPALRG